MIELVFGGCVPQILIHGGLGKVTNQLNTYLLFYRKESFYGTIDVVIITTRQFLHKLFMGVPFHTPGTV